MRESISRLKEKYSDPHMLEVARGTVLAFFLKVTGTGLAFGFNVLLARMLGAEGVGIYFLSASVVAVATVIARIGLDNAMLSYIARYATHKQWGQVKGIYSLGIKVAVVGATVITVLLFVSAPWLANAVFSKPLLAEPLRWMSLSILPFVLFNLQSESLKGLKLIKEAMLVQGVYLPLITLILIVPLTQVAGVMGAVYTYSIGSMIVAILGGLAWKNATASKTEEKIEIPLKEIWKSCRHLYIISIMASAIIPFSPIILLGSLGSSEEVGLFGAASRVAMLASFLLVTINYVVAPKFAELYATGDMAALERTMRGSAFLTTLLTSPILFFLFFKADWVMSMFGTGFEEGGSMLSILALGQMVNLMSGSVGYVLMMTKNEKAFQDMTILSAVVLVISSLVLIPIWDGGGAAVSAALAVATLNIGSVWMVNNKLGLKLIRFSKKGFG